MSFRIDVVSEERSTVIRVIGVLSQSALADLAALCRQTSGPLILELSDLSIDPERVPELMHLAGGEVELRGLTPYLALLLYGDASQATKA